MKRFGFIVWLAGAIASLAGNADAQISGTVKDAVGQLLCGANVYWAETAMGMATDENGVFDFGRSKNSDRLVASFIGFKNDTVVVAPGRTRVDFILTESTDMDIDICVVERRRGLLKPRFAVENSDMISAVELTRAACCNLGESFTTNPSVDVSYSDAATGARQIRLLGLSGTYVQMLTENVPNYRGASSPYGLGYVPGPWMQSIQVSKGASSVKNGYESITGQINIEFKKPQADPALHVNLFTATSGKYEANADGNIHLTRRLSTAILAHYEDASMEHDRNKDGFMDMPKLRQYNLQNRWAWMGDRYIFQAVVKGLKEERVSGQTDHGGAMSHEVSGNRPAHFYRIGIETDRYETFVKNAYIFNKERNANIALILAGSLHKMRADYGEETYDVDQKNGYASLMFESDFGEHHSISIGASMNYDDYDETLPMNRFFAAESPSAFRGKSSETVPGAYVQYTYRWQERWTLMGGFRVDHSDVYGTFYTPRAHLKFAPNDIFSLRASAGKGYRTSHPLAENNFLLASARRISMDAGTFLEEAWNYGASVAFNIPLFDKPLALNAEYYYTDFLHQMVVDLDTDAHAIAFTDLQGDSYSHTVQLEATYPVFRGFTLTGAYRLTDARTTYGEKLLRRPLTGRYKGLLTASYQTPLELWQFDVTLQFNGGGRMPAPYEHPDGMLSWNHRYQAFEQLGAQVTRTFRHWSVYIGGENLTDFRQKHPIVGTSDPWGKDFDATMVWGNVEGIMGYIGVRFNWEKRN